MRSARTLEQQGYRSLSSIDIGAQVRTSDVRDHLSDTTPDEVLEDLRLTFSQAQLRVERTTPRWTTS